MTIDLSKYIDSHKEQLVESVQLRLAANTSPALDPDLIMKDASHQVSFEEVKAFLDHLYADGLISVEDIKHCVSEQCSEVETARPLTNEEIAESRCSICDQNFTDTGGPGAKRYYSKHSSISRDIRWMIVIHGFNAKKPWQEELSWRISNKLAYAAPVLIYKYGHERLGIFFRSRHKKLVKRLGLQIQSAFNHSKKSKNSNPPDVIVHSFGSLLFSKLLLSEEFSELKFGRVICVGSVISPQFDWNKQISEGRLESVLCHSGGKDCPVRVAQFFIPALLKRHFGFWMYMLPLR